MTKAIINIVELEFFSSKNGKKRQQSNFKGSKTCMRVGNTLWQIQ